MCLRQGFSAKGSQLLLALCQFGALANALFPLGLCRGALLLDRQHTAFKVGMQPIDALEGRFGAASPLLQAGQFCGHVRRFLLQAFALLAQGRQTGLLLFKG